MNKWNRLCCRYGMGLLLNHVNKVSYGFIGPLKGLWVFYSFLISWYGPEINHQILQNSQQNESWVEEPNIFIHLLGCYLPKVPIPTIPSCCFHFLYYRVFVFTLGEKKPDFSPSRLSPRARGCKNYTQLHWQLASKSRYIFSATLVLVTS